MTDLEKAARLALEALEYYQHRKIEWDYSDDAAITALRRALEQPAQQEPVAWGVFDGPNLHDVNFTEEDAQEMVRLKGDGSVVKPLYTSPQRKPWVGLTDEEIIEVIHPLVMADMADEATDYEIARAIEAELKEKNA